MASVSPGRAPDSMMARQLEAAVSAAADDLLKSESGTSGGAGTVEQILDAEPVDGALRVLQEDLAMLQAEQERGLSSLGGAIGQIGVELGAIRTQLTALAEPLLATQTPSGSSDQSGQLEPDIHRAQVEL